MSARESEVARGGCSRKPCPAGCPSLRRRKFDNNNYAWSQIADGVLQGKLEWQPGGTLVNLGSGMGCFSPNGRRRIQGQVSRSDRHHRSGCGCWGNSGCRSASRRVGRSERAGTGVRASGRATSEIACPDLEGQDDRAGLGKVTRSPFSMMIVWCLASIVSANWKDSRSRKHGNGKRSCVSSCFTLRRW